MTFAPPQPGERMKWYRPPQKHVDTLVFVHGILGHYVDTWGKFPELLHTDLDLPDLDILLWGYRTGWWARHHDLETEGKHLTSHLAALVQADLNIFLVGHSMGGLVILKGLTDRMIGNQAQAHPVGSITWITLYACPLNGAWIAGVARILWGRVLGIRRSLDKHLKDLTRGTFIDALMSRVVNHIYRPMANDQANRRIPIRLVVATNDGAVDPVNRDATLTLYQDPSPLQLDEDHGSVKLPTFHGDPRYRALSHDLQSVFAREFQQLCARVNDLTLPREQRQASLREIVRRYGKIIDQRVNEVVADRAHLRAGAQAALLQLMVADGAAQPRPPFDVASRARNILRRRPQFQ